MVTSLLMTLRSGDTSKKAALTCCACSGLQHSYLHLYREIISGWMPRLDIFKSNNRALLNQLKHKFKKGQKAVKTEFLLGKTDRLYVFNCIKYHKISVMNQ